ncbi:Hypothetical predicted protein [Paramuricea clavata]|uniref:Uncharacterized protein n=1 Tax=Paramuricea clavata TaxID=317549 RepID=A0A7D9DL30_PARCT|nr:Hypothetical predicted protein [Paramuricea clavata]
MASAKLPNPIATPNLKRRTDAVRKKQLQLQQMLLNPKGFLHRYMAEKKKVVKRKAVKCIQDTDRAWFGTQQGGNLRTRRKPVNKLPTIYQYYQ